MELTYVRSLANRGLCIIPLRPPIFGIEDTGKQPALDKWKHFNWKTGSTEPPDPPDDRPTDVNLEDWFQHGRGLAADLSRDRQFRVSSLNAAVLLGRASSVIVVDTDKPETEAWVAANLPPTPMMTITRRGFHRFYRLPLAFFDDGRKTSFSFPIPGADLAFEVRGDGLYVVAPGSVHESGHVYREAQPWPPDVITLPEVPSILFGPTSEGNADTSARLMLPTRIRESSRHETLRKLMRSLKIRGHHVDVALTFCLRINRERCDPPIADLGRLNAYLRRCYDQEDRPGFNSSLPIEAETAPRPAWLKSSDAESRYRYLLDLYQPEAIADAGPPAINVATGRPLSADDLDVDIDVGGPAVLNAVTDQPLSADDLEADWTGDV